MLSCICNINKIRNI
uniref:Uncharacterized protein n=1 Tax=Arundo donax TaxID=35708 RepID=A0A0A8ZRZ6_ARUDO